MMAHLHLARTGEPGSPIVPLFDRGTGAPSLSSGEPRALDVLKRTGLDINVGHASWPVSPKRFQVPLSVPLFTTMGTSDFACMAASA
jgi:hypothetical protein